MLIPSGVQRDLFGCQNPQILFYIYEMYRDYRRKSNDCKSFQTSSSFLFQALETVPSARTITCNTVTPIFLFLFLSGKVPVFVYLFVSFIFTLWSTKTAKSTWPKVFNLVNQHYVWPSLRKKVIQSYFRIPDNCMSFFHTRIMRHKVIFQAEFNSFEFKVFLLLDQLQGMSSWFDG